jgi:hypothetical protein
LLYEFVVLSDFAIHSETSTGPNYLSYFYSQGRIDFHVLIRLISGCIF